MLVAMHTVKHPSLADLYEKEIKIPQLKWELMEHNLSASLDYNTHDTKPTFRGAYFDEKSGKIQLLFHLQDYRKYFNSVENAKAQLTHYGKLETSGLALGLPTFDKSGGDWCQVRFFYSSKEVATYEKGTLIVHHPEYLKSEQGKENHDK